MRLSQHHDTLESSQRALDGSVGPLTLGTIVAGTYRLERVIGVGGMGVVYEASDLRLPRRVAIKTARSAFFAKALRHEAQGLAAIRHAGFPTAYHFGTSTGIDYLVMERIHGVTLEERLDAMHLERRRFPVGDAIERLLAIAQALAAAHGVRVVHRDLKPSNVILATDGRTVLVDLGLFVPDVLVEDGAEPAGSVETIAPEVILGAVNRRRTAQIDLYALGAVAFELLAGAPPFVADTVEALLAHHVAAPVPDLSALRPEIPRPLAILVAELLAKDPAERPASAEDVVWRLSALLPDAPVRKRAS